MQEICRCRKKEDLENFFKDSDLKEIMVQWKDEKMRSMEMDDESTKSKLKVQIDNLRKYRRVELRTHSTHPSHEKAMMDKAADLAQKWNRSKKTRPYR